MPQIKPTVLIADDEEVIANTLAMNSEQVRL